MANKKHDDVIFSWLSKNLEKQKTIVDIGARRGAWYKALAKNFSSSPAILFEPTPSIDKVLRNGFYNSFPNAIVYKNALSNTNKETTFYIDRDDAAWSGLQQQKINGRYKSIKVEVRTLDSFNLDNVGLIKMDVEGNELYTLQGCVKTIKKFHPIIYFECADVHMTPYNYSSKDIYKFLESINYEILDLDLNILSVEELEKHTAGPSSFYHNFIARSK